MGLRSQALDIQVAWKVPLAAAQFLFWVNSYIIMDIKLLLGMETEQPVSSLGSPDEEPSLDLAVQVIFLLSSR